MAIANSIIDSEIVQADGKIRTVEIFTTNAGTIESITYDRDPALDKNLILASHATDVWNQIVQRECQSFVDKNIVPIFVDATKADLIAYVRSVYKNGIKSELIPIATWILDRITDGTVTDAQVQNAFNLTAANYLNLKTQMQNLVAANSVIEGTVGQ